MNENSIRIVKCKYIIYLIVLVVVPIKLEEHNTNTKKDECMHACKHEKKNFAIRILYFGTVLYGSYLATIIFCEKNPVR